MKTAVEKVGDGRRRGRAYDPTTPTPTPTPPLPPPPPPSLLTNATHPRLLRTQIALGRNILNAWHARRQPLAEGDAFHGGGFTQKKSSSSRTKIGGRAT